jgi:hypothetical protein
MSRENDKSPQINALEAALAALSPAKSQIDRDELMFRAGVAAAQSGTIASVASRPRRAAWMWLLATAASTLVAAMLGSLYGANQAPRLARRPEPQVIERIVEVPVYVDATAMAPADLASDTASDSPAQSALSGRFGMAGSRGDSGESNAGSYLQLRDTALSKGVDSLSYLQGARPTSALPPASYSDMRRDLLPAAQPRVAQPDQFNSLPPQTQDART